MKYLRNYYRINFFFILEIMKRIKLAALFDIYKNILVIYINGYKIFEV